MKAVRSLEMKMTRSNALITILNKKRIIIEQEMNKNTPLRDQDKAIVLRNMS